MEILSFLNRIAFGDPLNTFYTCILLSLTIVLALHLASTWMKQVLWKGKWRKFESKTQRHIHELAQVKSESDLWYISSGAWLEKLKVRLKANMNLPEASSTSEEFLQERLYTEPFLERNLRDIPSLIEKLPWLAIIIGCLGTLVGMVLILSTLSLNSGTEQTIKELTKRIPSLGETLWPIACGLLSALILRAIYNISLSYYMKRIRHLEKLHAMTSEHIFVHLYEKMYTFWGSHQPQNPTHHLAEDLHKWKQELGHIQHSLQNFAQQAASSMAPVVQGQNMLQQQISVFQKHQEAMEHISHHSHSILRQIMDDFITKQQLTQKEWRQQLHGIENRLTSLQHLSHLSNDVQQMTSALKEIASKIGISISLSTKKNFPDPILDFSDEQIEQTTVQKNSSNKYRGDV